MGSFERIDDTDARILELLQRDGRESYAEVGQAVGMSGPSAHERVKKLEARGVIRGYSALVDPTLLGYGVLAFIFIKQVPGTIATDMTGDFIAIDEIEECHHLAGESDYLLKVRATDTRHLERVLHSIQQVGHVFTTETQVVFSSAFERRPLRTARESDQLTGPSNS
ncbi:MAG: Lrp/AsnC family transcriptional regulator [Candidatus Limnocylindrales bacterium]|jgi:Lrp/AsnC family leucine-responsive transcriptional regulator